MNLALIAAMDENRVIGAKGTMPWFLPADLKHFRQITMGNPIIMGRKTHESIGKALEGRCNIVISRNPQFHAQGCLCVASLDAALAAAQQQNSGTAFIIGGGQLYAQTLDLATVFYLTQVHAKFQGDTYFPPWDQQQWETVTAYHHQADARHAHDYSFIELHRIRSSS